MNVVQREEVKVMIAKFSLWSDRVTFAFLFVVCFSAQTVCAALRITPAYLTVPLDSGRRPSGVFTLSNLGDTEERLRIGASHFTVSESGAIELSKTGEHSLAPWLYFNPKEVTLPPKTTRRIRFTIVSRGSLQEGEYWAAMEMESLKLTVATSKPGADGRTVSVAAATSTLVPIYGTVGRPRYEGVIKELRLLPNPETGEFYLFALVAATGTGRLRVTGKYEILSATGVGEIIAEGEFGGNAFICRGSQRWVRAELETDLAAKTYTARLTLNSVGLSRPMTKVAQVTCPKIQPKPAGDAVRSASNDSKGSESQSQAGDSKEAGAPEGAATESTGNDSKDSGSQSQTGGSKREAVDEKGGT
jgi:hypothetical protein